MKRLSIPLLGLVLMGAAGACGLNAEAEDGPMPANLEEARVAVTNNNWLDMTVYAVSGGRRVRLGMVNTMATERFTLPLSLVSGASSMHLVANPIGANGTYTTEAVSVWPGETVELTIQNQIGTSAVTIQ
ncbi:MAG: hypothetical protein WD766_06415 [Gemmatimonadota bacterium]